jgi:hypothetical protein
MRQYAFCLSNQIHPVSCQMGCGLSFMKIKELSNREMAQEFGEM